MDSSRIALIIRRVLIVRFLRFEQLVDFAFWPIIDVLIRGGIGRMIGKSSHDSESIVIMLAGVIMLRVFVYTQLDISFTFLTELQARNLTNLFVSPLSLGEWMVGLMLGGLCSAAALLAFSMVVTWLAYGILLYKLGIALLFLFLGLVVCGWAVGFVAATTGIIYGIHGERFIRILSWSFVPFSGVYYPLDIMPPWIQAVSKVIPMSYLVESFRAYIQQGDSIPTHDVIVNAVLGTLLAGIFLACGMGLFVYKFNQARYRGLMRLEVS